MHFDREKITSRLQSIRRHLDLTQKEIAAALDISQSNYSDMEASRASPRLETLLKMVELYNVNLNFLLFGRGPMFLELDNQPDMDSEAIQCNGSFLKGFFYYFIHSPIYRCHMMAHHYEITLNRKKEIREDMEAQKKAQKNETDE